eukprot:scaffold53139_cov69-Phaeocystis_antarctica.AAC.6
MNTIDGARSRASLKSFLTLAAVKRSAPVGAKNVIVCADSSFVLVAWCEIALTADVLPVPGEPASSKWLRGTASHHALGFWRARKK